jgi:hypothetical protein
VRYQRWRPDALQPRVAAAPRFSDEQGRCDVETHVDDAARFLCQAAHVRCRRLDDGAAPQLTFSCCFRPCAELGAEARLSCLLAPTRLLSGCSCSCCWAASASAGEPGVCGVAGISGWVSFMWAVGGGCGTASPQTAGCGDETASTIAEGSSTGCAILASTLPRQRGSARSAATQ